MYVYNVYNKVTEPVAKNEIKLPLPGDTDLAHTQ